MPWDSTRSSWSATSRPARSRARRRRSGRVGVPAALATRRLAAGSSPTAAAGGTSTAGRRHGDVEPMVADGRRDRSCPSGCSASPATPCSPTTGSSFAYWPRGLRPPRRARAPTASCRRSTLPFTVDRRRSSAARRRRSSLIGASARRPRPRSSGSTSGISTGSTEARRGGVRRSLASTRVTLDLPDRPRVRAGAHRLPDRRRRGAPPRLCSTRRPTPASPARPASGRRCSS